MLHSPHSLLHRPKHRPSTQRIPFPSQESLTSLFTYQFFSSNLISIHKKTIFYVMQTSYSYLSRLYHSPRHSFSILNSSFYLLCKRDLFKTHNSFDSCNNTAYSNDFCLGYNFVAQNYCFQFSSYTQSRGIHTCKSSKGFTLLGLVSLESDQNSKNGYKYLSQRGFFRKAKQIQKIEINDQHSQRAVTTALWCNFLVFSLKLGVWLSSSSHVMLAEVVHSIADFANQALLAYGLSSSRRAPDDLHPYGYSKDRFVWPLISAVGIFCLGSGATILNGIQNLWIAHPPANIEYAALVIGGSFIIEGASLIVAIQAVKKGAAAEGMKLRDYIWRGHDPTSVAVMTEDGAAVIGLAISAASLVAVNFTGNPIYDPIGSILVGGLLGLVAGFLIQRNRHALIGRAIDEQDLQKVQHFLRNDPVVDEIYDCKSEVIGPGFFRFKAEIDFNGEILVQNMLNRTGREEWAEQFYEAAKYRDHSFDKKGTAKDRDHSFDKKGRDHSQLLKTMSSYGEELVNAIGSEIDRLEKEIQELVPGIRHVDIEVHNPTGPSP